MKLFVKNSWRDVYEGESKERALPDNVRLNSPGSSVDSRPNLIRTSSKTIKIDYIKQLHNLLDSEIRKIFLFFQKKERELYVSINSHLHIREQYHSFNTYNIMKEYEELCNISNATKNLCKYINQNMIGLKRILMKFDKYFEYYYDKQAINYIESKIKSKNSDLLYILQFKVK